MNDLIVRPENGVVPVAEKSRTAGDPTPAEKAAIILSVLDPADASNLLQNFAQDSLLKFAHVINGLKPVPTSVMIGVVNEFLAELGEETNVRGGQEQVRKFLSQFMDAQDVDQMLSAISGTTKRSVWERLGDAPNEKAAAYLQLEHPQTVAIVLSKLRPDKAAGILERLDRGLAQTAVLRLSRVPNLSAPVLKSVEDAIEKEFLSAMSRQMGSVKPSELIGDLMNNVSSSAREEFLENLGQANQDLAQEVLRVMFTFADIVDRVEPRDVAKIVKETEEEQLMLALKYAKDTDNPSCDFMLSNLSKRLAERMNEDIDSMEPVKERDGEAAQMVVTNLIQKLAKMGEIKLIENDPDE